MKKTAVTFLLAALLLCTILPASVPAAAVEDTGITINVYNWGEYISTGDDDLMDVNEEFYNRTGIRVNYTTFDTNESLYTKLKSGGVSYDVIIPSDYMISKMIAEGMLLELNYDNIPNYSLIDDRFKTDCEYDPANKYSVPYTWGEVGILYNTKYVTEPVDSWEILWNEQYRDKILMFDNQRDAFGIAQKLLGYSFNSDNEAEWTAAAEKLKEQHKVNPHYVMDQIFDKMSSEDAWIAPYYSGDFLTIHDLNENVQLALPKEGTNLFVDAMCIPTCAANKEAAEAYINFMCETDVATDNISFISYSSPQMEAAENHKAYLAEEYGDWAVEAIYPDDLSNCETFQSLSEETNKRMDDLWVEVKSAGNSSSMAILLVVGVLVVIVVVLIIFRIRKKRMDAEI